MAPLAAACSVSRAFLPQQQRRSTRQRGHMAAAAPGGAAARRAVVCAASIKFAKYQGLGNDFILVRRGRAVVGRWLVSPPAGRLVGGCSLEPPRVVPQQHPC